MGQDRTEAEPIKASYYCHPCNPLRLLINPPKTEDGPASLVLLLGGGHYFQFWE